MSNTKIDSKYKTMFSDYPDVVTVAQLRKMLGISRHLKRSNSAIHIRYQRSMLLSTSFKVKRI